jgi:DDE superfamily endonuclease
MIIFGIINAPGTVHDSTMASFFGVYDKLQNVYDETGLKCIMDSAFCASEYEFITKSSQNFEQCHFNDMETMAINSAATSMRQAAEWGMAALQGSFPRLTDTFPYEDGPGERLETLKMIMLLYNFRCKYVGLNQLRNTFVPEWSKDAQFLMH